MDSKNKFEPDLSRRKRKKIMLIGDSPNASRVFEEDDGEITGRSRNNLVS